MLPFIVIIILVLGGLGYWRFVASAPKLDTPQTSQDDGPIEVPKTLPEASLEDRIKILEDVVLKLVKQVNSSKSTTTQTSPDSASDSDSNTLQAQVTELKARVSALESGSPAPSGISSKSTIYIPLGSGGQMSSTSWVTLDTFQISLDPSQYSGYSSMQLEVNMRLNQPGGTLYARLYNLTSGSATSSEVTSTSTSSTVQTSSTFTLPSGNKTYILQAKTSDGTLGFLDYARIKVNF